MEKEIPFKDLRDQLGERIAQLDVTDAGAYANFIRNGDPDGPTPCWGAIKQRFEANFPADEDRIKLLDVLMQDADKRVMLLFLDSNRERPAVRQALLARLDGLPTFLQEAVVAMSPVEEIPDDVKEKLHPRARELAEADDAARATERELVEARIKRILAFEYFVPDSGDPREEPDQEPSTSAEEQATR